MRSRYNPLDTTVFVTHTDTATSLTLDRGNGGNSVSYTWEVDATGSGIYTYDGIEGGAVK